MTDELTEVGGDGIRRSFDEHYDTIIDVERDPWGAVLAINKQARRIEELEAAYDAAYAAYDAADAACDAAIGAANNACGAAIDAANDAAVDAAYAVAHAALHAADAARNAYWVELNKTQEEETND
jgi:hypothetical protein